MNTTTHHIHIQKGYTPAVVTAMGQDTPGVSASFFDVLSKMNAQVLDVEQEVFRGQLNLAALVAVPEEHAQEMPSLLTESLEDKGMSISLSPVDITTLERAHPTHTLVVIGRPITAQHISLIGKTLSEYGANIDEINGLADYPLTGLTLKITIPDAAPGKGIPLRKALTELAQEHKFDLSIDREGLNSRAKRLICFDVDSTLIQGEVIEMLAAYAGREEEVAAVTERAMRGEIDFSESLRERVKPLAGLDVSVVDEVAQKIELTPGARTTIRTLKRLGYKTGVVSGGFIQVIQPMAQELGLDFARANTLEVQDGKLTGRVLGDIIDREAKAESLKEFAWSNGIDLNQTVAVGDGANDIDMLSTAGLGIAFNAKPALREVADAAVNHPFLDEVLFMLGVSSDDIEDADIEDGLENVRKDLTESVI